MAPALEALLVFVAMAVLDFMWARYLVATTAGRASHAANWSSMIVLAGALVVVEYTARHWLIPAAAAGAWVGTFLSIRLKKKGSS